MKEKRIHVHPWCLRKGFNEKKKKKSGQGINGIGCFGITLIPYKGKRKNGLNGLYFYS
jgi:hypothetical protein